MVLANGLVSNEESVVLCRWAEVFAQLFRMENPEQMNFTGVIDTNNAGVLSQDLTYLGGGVGGYTEIKEWKSSRLGWFGG